MAPVPVLPLASTTPQDFWAAHIAKRRPAVLDGIDPAWASWTDDALIAAAGDARVMVERRGSAAEAFGQGVKVPMLFGDLVRALQAGDTGLYLSTQEVGVGSDGHPLLYGAPLAALEGRFPLRQRLMGQLVPQSINMWMGCAPEGSSSGLHHDFHDNLYVLLRGTKRLRLFPPSMAHRMYLSGRLTRTFPNGRIVYEGQGDVQADGAGAPRRAAPRRRAAARRGGAAAGRAAERAAERAARPRARAPDLHDVRLWQARHGADAAAAAAGDSDADSGAEAALEAQLEAMLDEGAALGGRGGDDYVGSDDPAPDDDDDDDGSQGDSGSDSDDDGDASGRQRGGGKRHAKTLGSALLPAAKRRAGGAPPAAPAAPRRATEPPPPSFSGVDLSLPPAELRRRFPRFPGLAAASEVVLRAGQMLYLPAGWFHEVTSFGGPGAPQRGAPRRGGRVRARRHAHATLTPRSRRRRRAGREGGGGGHLAVNYWYHPPDVLDPGAAGFASPYSCPFLPALWAARAPRLQAETRAWWARRRGAGGGAPRARRVGWRPGVHSPTNRYHTSMTREGSDTGDPGTPPGAGAGGGPEPDSSSDPDSPSARRRERGSPADAVALHQAAAAAGVDAAGTEGADGGRALSAEVSAGMQALADYFEDDTAALDEMLAEFLAARRARLAAGGRGGRRCARPEAPARRVGAMVPQDFGGPDADGGARGAAYPGSFYAPMPRPVGQLGGAYLGAPGAGQQQQQFLVLPGGGVVGPGGQVLQGVQLVPQAQLQPMGVSLVSAPMVDVGLPASAPLMMTGGGPPGGMLMPGALYRPLYAQQQQQQQQQQAPAPRGRHAYGGTAGAGAGGLWAPLPGGGAGGGVSPYHLGQPTNVEDILQMLRTMPRGSSAIPVVADSLRFLDSRALAALLKELSKTGLREVAFEIFDWLRAQSEAVHPEYAGLLDVFTYTTMIVSRRHARARARAAPRRAAQAGTRAARAAASPGARPPPTPRPRAPSPAVGRAAQAQCTNHMHLPTALELVNEMRGRRVPLNTHTYSAMLNVCIKAGELELALDVFNEARSVQTRRRSRARAGGRGREGAARAARSRGAGVARRAQMLAEGLQPNLVTFNTLLEVYAKRGMWREAVGVLDTLEQQVRARPRAAPRRRAGPGRSRASAPRRRAAQRLVPEPRTFNIVMNACNAAGQHASCIAVHGRMVGAKVPPTVGTYNAVVLAHCKLEQPSSAQALFSEMPRAGCMPTHTTFITLLQSAEAHGQAAVAVSLLEQMSALSLRLTPQCYAAAIGACAAAGQLATARRLLGDMLASSKAGMAAPAHIIMQLQDRCADWVGAHRTYQKLLASGVRPDAQTTATAIEALWGAGSVASCLLALAAFEGACKAGVFRLAVAVRPGDATVEFSLPVAGTCMALIGLWRLLAELRGRLLRDGPKILRASVVVLLGDGQAAVPSLQAAMTQARARARRAAARRACCTQARARGRLGPPPPDPARPRAPQWCAVPGVPFELEASAAANQVALSAPATTLAAWLLGDGLLLMCPVMPPAAELEGLDELQLQDAEAAALAACRQQLVEAKEAEAALRRGANALPPAYRQARAALAQQLQAACAAAPQAAQLHGAALTLLDEAAAAGLLEPRDGGAEQPVPQAQLLAACVAVSAQATAGAAGPALPSEQALAQQFGVAPEELASAAGRLREACGAACDVPVSAAGVLETYVQALLAGQLDRQVPAASLVGEARALAGHLPDHAAALELPPTSLAALLVAAGRSARGLYPAWPKVLVVLTGMVAPAEGAQQLLDALVRTAATLGDATVACGGPAGAAFTSSILGGAGLGAVALGGSV
ncbi:jmj4 [Scenedesmus sp. PABB004]|nr:jmj4 [Scenedesmus sp. PABB004]